MALHGSPIKLPNYLQSSHKHNLNPSQSQHHQTHGYKILKYIKIYYNILKYIKIIYKIAVDR